MDSLVHLWEGTLCSVPQSMVPVYIVKEGRKETYIRGHEDKVCDKIAMLKAHLTSVGSRHQASFVPLTISPVHHSTVLG